jgi:predicted  nucleic acid-binding Zn-ribbon protein
VTTAPATDQRRLLDVQALDTRAAQLAHRRRTLPALADLEAVRKELADAEREQVTARTSVRDLKREVAKAEADVEQVRSRATRDRQRLDSGTGSPKDLQALGHELESLARRQSVLEEVELEIMERLEAAERALQVAVAHSAELAAQEAALKAQVDAALALIDADAAAVAKDRAEAAQGLDPGLVALYERIRVQSGGVGAAELRGNRCEGCRLELNSTDLARIRAMPPEAVARCEECGRILVRTGSGRGSA